MLPKLRPTFHRPSNNHQRSRDPTSAPFQKLPTETIFSIASHLDDKPAVCFQNTNSVFQRHNRARPKDPSPAAPNNSSYVISKNLYQNAPKSQIHLPAHSSARRANNPRHSPSPPAKSSAPRDQIQGRRKVAPSSNPSPATGRLLSFGKHPYYTAYAPPHNVVHWERTRTDCRACVLQRAPVEFFRRKAQ